MTERRKQKLVQVTPDKHRLLKIDAARRDIPISELINEILDDYFAEVEESPKAVVTNES